MITYREYMREIENNIEQNLLDQVIAHSTYILKTYPNSIEALRYLAQAYLEEKKFAEAKACFEKVLSFIPDDFVSHVGLSSIKEEDRDINAAIYHMELAFDTQPSNTIVQEELKRLISLRDGEKPLKINLSKGALIRMYIKGDLLQQAKNETETYLSCNPGRLDIQVLLAKILYSSSLKVQAAETCNQIIEHLPYCLEANRLLYFIYLENGLQEQAKIVKERLISLNPYFQFVDAPNIEIEEIPDEKVQIERLVYTSAFSANIEDFIPIINNSAKDRAAETPPQPLPSIFDEPLVDKDRNNDAFPDFLTEAGWEKSSNPQNEPPEPIYESYEKPIAPAEKAPLPDWLENFKVSNEFFEKKPVALSEEPVGIIDEDDIAPELISNVDDKPSDLLSTINEVEMTTDNPQSPFGKDESSDWMSQFFDEAKNATSPSEDDKQLPEWLKSFEENERPHEEEKKEDVPDWLKSLDSEIVAKEETISEDSQDILEEKKSDEPDWLRSLVTDNEPLAPIDQTNSVESEEVIPDQSPLDEISSLAFLDEISDKNGQENTPSNFTVDAQATKQEQDHEFSTAEPQDNLSEDLLSTKPQDNEPIPQEKTESFVPDWVKSVLSDSSFITDTNNEQPDKFFESSETKEDFSENVPEVSTSQGPDNQMQGAISQETSEELLNWIKEISPDSGMSTSVEEPATPPTLETSELLDILDTSLDHLEGINEEIPVTNAIEEIVNPVFPTETENVESIESIVNDTTVSEGNVDQVSPDTFEASQTDFPGAEDPLEKLTSLVQSKDYTEASVLLPELTSSGVEEAKIVDKLNSLKSELLDDFGFLQFFGDTLAGFGRFEEAMDIYTQAEKILK